MLKLLNEASVKLGIIFVLGIIESLVKLLGFRRTDIRAYREWID